jgi:hypothetical protein
MPDRMPENMSDRISKDLPDRMPENMPENIPEDIPEDIPDRMPDRIPEDILDRMPEDLPVRKYINAMMGIIRNEIIYIIEISSNNGTIILLSEPMNYNKISNILSLFSRYWPQWQ